MVSYGSYPVSYGVNMVSYGSYPVSYGVNMVSYGAYPDKCGAYMVSYGAYPDKCHLCSFFQKHRTVFQCNRIFPRIALLEEFHLFNAFVIADSDIENATFAFKFVNH